MNIENKPETANITTGLQEEANWHRMRFGQETSYGDESIDRNYVAEAVRQNLQKDKKDVSDQVGLRRADDQLKEAMERERMQAGIAIQTEGSMHTETS